MNPIIIANWKMNLQFQEAIRSMHIISRYKNSKGLIIAPPIPYLGYLSQNFQNISFCAQNISTVRGFGPYTGEYSADMIKSCNTNYALIGHSDRKNFCDEDNTVIRHKILNAINAGITPIICFGETTDIRKNNNYKDYLINQLSIFLSGIDHKIKKELKLIIAYEPVWAIGSGMTPTVDDISEIFELIISNAHVSGLAKNIYLVYGGSVNSRNYHEIMSAKYINGVLIGSASVNTNELATIMNYSN